MAQAKHVPTLVRRNVAFIAVALAGLVTLLGTWAFMTNIHAKSVLLLVVVVAAFPIAAFASTFDFFDSTIVYWASIIAGFLFWIVVLYALISLLVPRTKIP
jgi:hypothetical protein